MAYFSSGFVWKLKAKHVKKLRNIVRDTALKSAIAIPWELPEILLLSKIPRVAW